MAIFTGPKAVVVGVPSDVDATAKNTVGDCMTDERGRQYLYLKGVADTVIGSWVTYDELGVTTLLAANAKGPVAVAQGASVANTWGWYCVFAPVGVPAMVAANTADNTYLGFETTAGHAGDGRAAGDEIVGAIARGATAGAAALATVQLFYPFVNDATGA